MRRSFCHRADEKSGLAVQGKLVPQDPNDESASVLLERIDAEKQRLIQEKIMKKTEVLPAIEFNSIPFDLPEGWQWAGLGRLSRITEYGTSEKASEVKLDVPVLRMNNIEGGKIRDSDKKVMLGL